MTIVDCDVHQGDGTAAIFSDDSSVRTVSFHCQDNFPANKQVGSVACRFCLVDTLLHVLHATYHDALSVFLVGSALPDCAHRRLCQRAPVLLRSRGERWAVRYSRYTPPNSLRCEQVRLAVAARLAECMAYNVFIAHAFAAFF